MASPAGAHGMEQAIRTYIQACNDANASAIAACFRDDAVHYRIEEPKWSGAATIAANFAERVAETGMWWTVDQVLTDIERCQAVLEWTRFNPKGREILRGVDWFVFEPQTGRICEVRPYVAAAPSADVARQEQRDFDYAGRGYPTNFPAG